MICGMRRFAWSVSIAAAALGAASAAQAPATGLSTVQPLSTPAAPGSGQPQLSASPRGVILSWIERSGDRATLRFAERTPQGWSPARSVASGSDWFVNWADVPSVVRLSDGTFVAHWLQKSGASTYAYDVRLAHSADGVTWSPSVL